MRSVGCLSSKLSRRAKRRLEKARAEVQEGQPAENEVSDDPMRDVLASISNADNIMLPTYGRGRGRGRGRGESLGRGRGRGRGQGRGRGRGQPPVVQDLVEQPPVVPDLVDNDEDYHSGIFSYLI